jgi:transposase
VKKLYIIDLEPAERDELTELVEKGTVAAYRRRHAQILLLANQGVDGPAWRDSKIASHVGVTVQNVERIRKRCVLEGLEAALGRRKRSRERATVLDGEGEAKLIAIACSEPPSGRARWTLHMLCDELKRRRVVRSISHETVRKVLKKTSSSRGDRRCGASRHSRTPPSCAGWRTSWKCIPGRTMRPIR